MATLTRIMASASLSDALHFAEATLWDRPTLVSKFETYRGNIEPARFNHGRLETSWKAICRQLVF